MNTQADNILLFKFMCAAPLCWLNFMGRKNPNFSKAGKQQGENSGNLKVLLRLRSVEKFFGKKCPLVEGRFQNDFGLS